MSAFDRPPSATFAPFASPNSYGDDAVASGVAMGDPFISRPIPSPNARAPPFTPPHHTSASLPAPVARMGYQGTPPSPSLPFPPSLAPAAAEIALTAFCLGAVCAVGISFGLVLLLPSTFDDALRRGPMANEKGVGGGLPSWDDWTGERFGSAARWIRPQLFFFVGFWALFHMLEFWITATYNRSKVFVDSFLLNNGRAYHIAHAVGILEFIVGCYLFPERKSIGQLTYVGLALMVMGQTCRSLAMIQASENFSHIVAVQKKNEHQLVTWGVYGYLRHPSYFGFYYWAVGTQIMLCNPAATLGFSVVLWRFFNNRIRDEERFLVRFFGQDYVRYRDRVRTWIPFIR